VAIAGVYPTPDGRPLVDKPVADAEHAAMPVRTAVIASFYRDSVVLMSVARDVRGRPGVREVAAFMGTPANQALLADAGLATAETARAGPADLVLSVDADSEAAADEALAAARAMLADARTAADRTPVFRPRTLARALAETPDANVVAISVPGAFARYEAMRALQAGRHVFLFSDNVPLADEIALKREAAARGFLCMGPDCGTAYLAGVALGFANAVPRGRIGCVAASGTGMQAVASRVASLGEGISHGIGVGGRDLAREVGGSMTVRALEALAHDAGTAAVVLVSKPPDESVLPALEAALGRVGKPLVVCCLGTSPRRGAPGRWVETLDQAADAVVAAVRGGAWAPRPFADPADVERRLARVRARGVPRGLILGLFTGGTLAHEARVVLGPAGAGRHRLVDLGDDAFTVGRPHPMIDPDARADRILAAARDRDVAVLLLDVVLGRGAHGDPAGVVARAFEGGRAAAADDGRRLEAVASVIGTAHDPQGLEAQVARLAQAGIEVLGSSAEAARFAGLLVAPDAMQAPGTSC
jgi:FdrA protein